MPDKRPTDAEVAELNAQVAERIMGFVRYTNVHVFNGDVTSESFPYCLLCPPERRDVWAERFGPSLDDVLVSRMTPVRLPHYTTDASAAEQVVVAMIDRGFESREDGFKTTDGLIFWEVSFMKSDADYTKTAPSRSMDNGCAEGVGPSAAPFICRAALAAIKGDDDA